MRFTWNGHVHLRTASTSELRATSSRLTVENGGSFPGITTQRTGRGYPGKMPSAATSSTAAAFSRTEGQRMKPNLRITDQDWERLRKQFASSFRSRNAPETGALAILGECKTPVKHEFI